MMLLVTMMMLVMMLFMMMMLVAAMQSDRCDSVLRDANGCYHWESPLAGDEHGVTVFLYRPVSHVNYFR